MTGGAGEAASSASGGEFLLQLLKNPPQYPNPPPPQQQQQQQQPPPSQILTRDPAVAAVGPTLPTPLPQLFQSNSGQPSWSHHHHQHSPPPFVPHNFFPQNPNSNPNLDLNFPSASPPGFNQACIQLQNDIRNFGFSARNSKANVPHHQQEQKDIIFGSLKASEGSVSRNFVENPRVSHESKGKSQTFHLRDGREVGFGNARRLNELEAEFQQHSSHYPRGSFHGTGCNTSAHGNLGKQGNNGHHYVAAAPPPGFANKHMTEYANRQGGFERAGEKGTKNFRESRYQRNKDESGRQFLSKNGKDNASRLPVADQLDCPGPLPGSKLHSLSASDIQESMMKLHCCDNRETEEARNGHKGQGYFDDLEEMIGELVVLEDESDDKSNKKKIHGPRDKDYRSDKRGQFLLGQRMRYMKRQLVCRGDIGRLAVPFLAIYESLIPAEEEQAKQRQLLALLENIVSKEWPDARLYLYGSCANSFGFSKSDIDVCLTIDYADLNKCDVLLKLADLLQSDNLQNVQALTRARVPIVKLMDPATGISCDICVNNVLAVVNTKLLRDYAEIDVRLRQLAFIVKHWAKSRGVNETYQGTLSSYAYVLMCIHFLQQRRPAILPCLQEMKASYSVMVDNVECAYFDKVENLVGFGSQNQESIAQLVWAFFNYWAYFHDYMNDVISVRTGRILSKHFKDWTRRVGNDRHLICIEDPFEVSHDLGRVVDKYSIKVLREEFERAAEVLQYDPNPCVKLFEPYTPI